MPTNQFYVVQWRGVPKLREGYMTGNMFYIPGEGAYELLRFCFADYDSALAAALKRIQEDIISAKAILAGDKLVSMKSISSNLKELLQEELMLKADIDAALNAPQQNAAAPHLFNSAPQA